MLLGHRFYTRSEDEVMEQLKGRDASVKVIFRSGRVVIFGSGMTTADTDFVSTRPELTTLTPDWTTTMVMGRTSSFLKIVMPLTICSTLVMMVAIVLCIKGEP